MKQIPVIFWTGTGNTQMMADVIAEAINAAGAEAVVKNVSEITADEAAGYAALALGCPAMGAEVLEECEFEPFFTELEGKLAGKKVALFGSYGWGGQSIGQVENALKDCKVEICLDMQKILNTPNPKLLKDLQNAVMGLKEA